MVIKYWQTALSLHRHQLEQSDILKNIHDHLPADMDVYQEYITRTLLAQICKAVKWKRKAQSDAYKKRATKQEDMIKENLAFEQENPGKISASKVS
eukprot:12750418-Ditylum_brightwellii.AAC.2